MSLNFLSILAKRLEMRLSVSPAAPFSVASLPNHTKMFELVHVVTSMDDFGTAHDTSHHTELSPPNANFSP